MIEENEFFKPNEIISFFKSAYTVKNERIVFNIFRNKYKLIAKFQYKKQFVFVRFIWTSKEYDSMEEIENI